MFTLQEISELRESLELKSEDLKIKTEQMKSKSEVSA